MKVGTDGVLLGAWASGENCKTMLDVGTGTGLLALMLLQRFPQLHIDAIDADTMAYTQALRNINNCPLPGAQSQIRVIHNSLHQWMQTADKKYDLIVCNPPYYASGFRVTDAARNMARVAENLPQDTLLFAAKQLLTDVGKLAIIYPVYEGEIFLDNAAPADLHCWRKTIVYTKRQNRAKRFLLEFGRHPQTCITNELVMEVPGQCNYTQEYKQLTQDFYLHF